jgi:diguanylate cyclase (GGDEF)-like protein
LAGPAIQELLAADGALLLVDLGGHEYITEFDRSGSMQPAREETALCRHARLAMANQTPILLPDVAADSTLRAEGPSNVETMSLLAYPFPPIKPIGVLAAFWCQRGRQHQLARQISTLRHIGELTGAGLGNVAFRQVLERQVEVGAEKIAEAAREHAVELHRRDLREEEIHRLSVTDVLTGMLNRRGFFLHAERSFKLARRQGIPSALIFADIDGLKAVNDALGHDAGDRLIQDGARILQDSFRDSDVIARLGGDEFAALTLGSSEPQVILARIEENIEGLRPRSSSPYRISFSAGIVQCHPSSDLTLSEYLSMADKQMYANKKKRFR